MSQFSDRFDDGASVIRLYDENGEHLASILPCDYNRDGQITCDLADPDGKVLYCGIDEDLTIALAKVFGIEKIDKEED